jgi:hypothetical protein
MIDPVLDQPDITRYDRGYTLLMNGSKADGMPMITASAFAGQPHAISTLIWQNVVDGQIDEAINNYAKCFTPAHTWIETESRRLAGIRQLPAEGRHQIIEQYQYQISNFKSNAALAYLAANQEATALKMWAAAAKDHGHIESRFYPIFHQKKNDPAAVMKHLSENFHPEELKSLITSLAEETKGSIGWFKNFSNDSLEVLRKVNQQAMAGTVAITGAWMASRAVRHYFEEENEETLDQAADSFFNWLGDFFG